MDPWLLALLALGVLALAWRPNGRLALAGWLLAGLILISPLCNLSVALFSARVAQHLLLMLLAAPLLALAWPAGRATRAGGAAFVFAAAIWAWHLPAPYLATFDSPAAYWAMQASLLMAATWLWAALRQAATARPASALLAALGTSAQMAALGALLTLAPRALFERAHQPGVTAAWGLTPLEDQQLGGVLMWAPGGLLFVLAGAAIATAMLRPRAVG
ncbi:cytochrome c oxidase assembly protein [Roseococcus sp. YIM B11640]|uniref:cytochrome c oxidase assembly protein n=1 Tax=Roseococcus sp. YIM B11640 TaxID=3133973 RepID=UPI003C7AD5EE